VVVLVVSVSVSVSVAVASVTTGKDRSTLCTLSDDLE
jgi:hypothetical protein